MLAVMQHLSAAIKPHKTHRTEKPQQRDFSFCNFWFCRLNWNNPVFTKPASGHCLPRQSERAE